MVVSHMMEVAILTHLLMNWSIWVRQKDQFNKFMLTIKTRTLKLERSTLEVVQSLFLVHITDVDYYCNNIDLQ